MPILSLGNLRLRWLFAELFVVVLGILIAFQIEQWREERAARVLTIANLEAMLFELEDEFSEVALKINSLEENIEGIANLSTALINDRMLDSAWLGQTYGRAVSGRIWQPSAPTYLGLRESGQLHLFENFKLRAELFDYYEYAAFVNSLLTTEAATRQQLIEVSRRDIFGITEIAPGSDEITSRRYVVEPVEDFPRHPDFLGTLSNLGRVTSNLLPRLESLLERNTELKQSILEYLGIQGIQELEIPTRAVS